MSLNSVYCDYGLNETGMLSFAAPQMYSRILMSRYLSKDNGIFRTSIEYDVKPELSKSSMVLEELNSLVPFVLYKLYEHINLNFVGNNRFEDVWYRQGINIIENSNIKTFQSINWIDKKYILQQQINCNVSYEKGYVFLTYEPLNIRVYAKTLDLAIRYFNEEFNMLWEAYVREDDANLTKDAIILKNKIKSYVKELICNECSKNK